MLSEKHIPLTGLCVGVLGEFDGFQMGCWGFFVFTIVTIS